MRKIAVPLAILACLAMAFTVQSAGKPTGSFKVATPGVVLELKTGSTPADKPMPVPTGKEVQLPVGSYSPASLTCYAQGAGARGKAELWSIKSVGPFGKLATIDVAEGTPAVIEAGAPLVLKVSASAPTKTPTGMVVTIGFTITGKSGEIYNSGMIKKGQNAVPAPSLRILDEKGTVIQQGTFEYG